jgi:hypothetical protein
MYLFLIIYHFSSEQSLARTFMIKIPLPGILSMNSVITISSLDINILWAGTLMDLVNESFCILPWVEIASFLDPQARSLRSVSMVL